MIALDFAEELRSCSYARRNNFPDETSYQGVEKREKPQKIRHTGAGRYPEAVDFVDHVALDPGLRRGDGVFFNTLLHRSRQSNRHQQTALWMIFGLDPAMLGLDGATRDGEAQPDAAVVAVARGIDADKGFEDGFQHVVGYARAMIAYAYHMVAAASRSGFPGQRDFDQASVG
jgi:hypothetical protein